MHPCSWTTCLSQARFLVGQVLALSLILFSILLFSPCAPYGLDYGLLCNITAVMPQEAWACVPACFSDSSLGVYLPFPHRGLSCGLNTLRVASGELGHGYCFCPGLVSNEGVNTGLQGLFQLQCSVLGVLWWAMAHFQTASPPQHP